MYFWILAFLFMTVSSFPQQHALQYHQKRPVHILFQFRFIKHPVYAYLKEVKYLDVPADAPPSDRFSWQLDREDVDGFPAKKLLFKSAKGEERWFQDGSHLDMTKLIYTDATQTPYHLTREIPMLLATSSK